MERRRSRFRRVAHHLGVTSSDKPRPSARQVLVAFLWVIPLVIVAAVISSAIKRADGPEWLRTVVLVAPISVAVGLMSRTHRTDRTDR